VCSGIEAATVAWHDLGWEPQWFSEIEKFPSAVLNHHYPNVPNFGDMTKFKEWKNAKPIDLLVGGTPCQSFSIAGLRKGLEDPRGNLMLTYLAMADRFKPKWLVWENVPGVLSSNGGKDFGTFLSALGEIGYGWAYRILDAQYYGVPQRRRRVFLVGCLGDWRSAGEVLFEPESLSGNPPPCRETEQRVADCLTVGVNQYSGFNGEPVEKAGYAAAVGSLCARTGLSTSVQDAGQGHLIAAESKPEVRDVMGTITARMFNSLGARCVEEGAIIPTPTLDTSKTPAVLWSIMPQNSGKDYKARAVDVTQPLMAGGPVGGNQGGDVIQQSMTVRRLTPIECERLQGFPDNYTQIAYGKKTDADCPIGPRYKALGNSMAVPVMRWIGERINEKEGDTIKQA